MFRIVEENGLSYYSYLGIKTVQHALFENLCIVDNVCRNNNLVYFLDGGTAIGARRHRGFIPWDDDLDIGLLKHDFIKLLDCLSKDKALFLKHDLLTNHCSSYFGKKIDLFLYTKKGFRKLLKPICLDIRPINAVENNDYAKKENILLRNIANKLIFKRCDPLYEKEADLLFQNRFNSSSETFFHFYNYEYGFEKNNNDKEYLYAPPYLEFSTYSFFKKEHLIVKPIMFNGLNTFVTKSDFMLSDYYGDYMSVPKTLDDRKPENDGVCRFKRLNYIYKKASIKKQSFFNKVFYSVAVKMLARKIK